MRFGRIRSHQHVAIADGQRYVHDLILIWSGGIRSPHVFKAHHSHEFGAEYRLVEIEGFLGIALEV